MSKLYEKLLVEGDDPRKALNETRKALTDNQLHDWASLVAYTRFPDDIDDQINNIRLKVLLESMKTSNAWADHLLKYKNEIEADKIISAFENISARLDKSIGDLINLFATNPQGLKTTYAEHFGLLGSAFKRKAEHLFRMTKLKKEKSVSLIKESEVSLKTSREYYFQGYDKQKNHWTAIQYLSLTAIIEGTLRNPEDQSLWAFTKILAEDDAKESKDPITRIWAWGTLAELYLLYPLTLAAGSFYLDKEIEFSKGKAIDFIDKIAKAKISFAAYPLIKEEDIIFSQESTFRQFDRYISWWPAMIRSSSMDLLKEIAIDLIEKFKLFYH